VDEEHCPPNCTVQFSFSFPWLDLDNGGVENVCFLIKIKGKQNVTCLNPSIYYETSTLHCKTLLPLFSFGFLNLHFIEVELFLAQ